MQNTKDFCVLCNYISHILSLKPKLLILRKVNKKCGETFPAFFFYTRYLVVYISCFKT
jgi:hypothetical protein